MTHRRCPEFNEPHSPLSTLTKCLSGVPRTGDRSVRCERNPRQLRLPRYRIIIVVKPDDTDVSGLTISVARTRNDAKRGNFKYFLTSLFVLRPNYVLTPNLDVEHCVGFVLRPALCDLGASVISCCDGHSGGVAAM